MNNAGGNITAIEAEIVTINSQIDSINGQITDINNSIATLFSDIAAINYYVEFTINAQLATLNAYVSVNNFPDASNFNPMGNQGYTIDQTGRAITVVPGRVLYEGNIIAYPQPFPTGFIALDPSYVTTFVINNSGGDVLNSLATIIRVFIAPPGLPFSDPPYDLTTAQLIEITGNAQFDYTTTPPTLLSGYMLSVGYTGTYTEVNIVFAPTVWGIVGFSSNLYVNSYDLSGGGNAVIIMP